MKKIIILEKSNDDAGIKPTFNYVMWADVPQTRWASLANSGITTPYILATTFEKNALKSGMIVERADSFSIPVGNNFASIRSELVDSFNKFQTEISGNSKNVWQRYGTSWDGNIWANSGVS